MAEEMYMNSRGFKCVMSQLQKTDGRDPQDHARILQRAKEDGETEEQTKARLKALRVLKPEHDRMN